MSMLECMECGREAADVVAIHTFEDGSTYDECTNKQACYDQQAWNEFPCCGPSRCEGCTSLWELELLVEYETKKLPKWLQELNERYPDGPSPDQEVPF